MLQLPRHWAVASTTLVCSMHGAAAFHAWGCSLCYMGLQQHLLHRVAAWTTSVEAAPSTKRAGGGPSHSCAQISVGRSQRTRSSGGWPRLEGQRQQGQRPWAGTGAAPQPLVGIQATGVSSRVQKAALSKGGV